MNYGNKTIINARFIVKSTEHIHFYFVTKLRQKKMLLYYLEMYEFWNYECLP